MAPAMLNARKPSGAVVASHSVSMEFRVDEDNGGEYRWTLIDRDGNVLAQSPGFASYELAEDAARAVLASAGSARLDRRETDSVGPPGETSSLN